MKRTLERELKVSEIIEEEAYEEMKMYCEGQKKGRWEYSVLSSFFTTAQLLELPSTTRLETRTKESTVFMRDWV